MFSKLPLGMEKWLRDYLRDVERENQILRENGAEWQATAREAMARKLVERATAHYEEEIGTSEAAEILGVDEETVRRWVRAGALPDGRIKPGGHHKIRRGAVQARGTKRGKYDPVADAQDIAKLRRSA